MPTVTVGPQGLQFSRYRRAASTDLHGNRYKIKQGYATKIAMGDLVSTGTGGNLGYVILTASLSAPGNVLGVFGGVVGPFYDQNLQGPNFGLNGAYMGSAVNPSSDVDCIVYDDPDIMWRVQALNASWSQTWRGQNMAGLAGTNGVPSAAGISTLALDGTTAATTNTLPFRIQQLVAVQPGGIGLNPGLAIEEGGGTGDPTLTNPWVEVTLNYGVAELAQATGV